LTKPEIIWQSEVIFPAEIVVLVKMRRHGCRQGAGFAVGKVGKNTEREEDGSVSGNSIHDFQLADFLPATTLSADITKLVIIDGLAFSFNPSPPKTPPLLF
jgi:hypothetical protein